ncbi:DUF1330 domain-containing protein [Azospirillum sp. INR13]|uniref:DUF1330 domain-containing protein n=1 Tax=Azospirillum sp. INR13 TaxID=2596919 RepID=UPI0021063B62|nr:DUF1330 domain-containing protein [Azospirillum sp. INR13]
MADVSSAAAARRRCWKAIGSPNRIVILEFPDMATAKAFYHSPEYRKAREARRNAADFKMIVVEGL